MGLPFPRARLVVGPLPRPGGRVRLSREEAAHARARRLHAGDPVLLLDGTGREALGLLTRLDSTDGEVEVRELRLAARTGPPIHLFVAGVRAERLSWIAEKATELGAARLAIVHTERTQTFRAAASMVARLERVAREAAKQCESARWPAIAGPIPLRHVLTEQRAFHRFFFDFEGDRFPAELDRQPAALLVGPEGGWTGEERQAARTSGWNAVALPAGKLRTETAAVAALVLLRAAMERKT